MEEFLNTDRAPIHRYPLLPSNDTNTSKLPARTCPESWIERNKFVEQRPSARSEEARVSKLRDAKGMKDCLKYDSTTSNQSTTKHETQLAKYKAKAPQSASDHAVVDQYRRGFKHTSEIGNFSTYNGVLQKNQNAILER